MQMAGQSVPWIEDACVGAMDGPSHALARERSHARFHPPIHPHPPSTSNHPSSPAERIHPFTAHPFQSSRCSSACDSRPLRPNASQEPARGR